MIDYIGDITTINDKGEKTFSQGQIQGEGCIEWLVNPTLEVQKITKMKTIVNISKEEIEANTLDWNLVIISTSQHF